MTRTKNQSAGIVLYRGKSKTLEVLLVHPGGPFWKNKDAGSWSIPKGEFTSEEEGLDAALREFREETGFMPAGPFTPLTPIRQKSGKRVYAWAAEGDLDPAAITSNSFEIEWPPASGRLQSFHEVDKAAWLAIPAARRQINPAQTALLDELADLLMSGV